MSEPKPSPWHGSAGAGSTPGRHVPGSAGAWSTHEGAGVPSAHKPPATATAELVLRPQVREFAGRRYVFALVAIALLVAAAVVAVRRLALLEEALAAQGARSGRVMVYEAPSGAELRAPIEAKTDVIRLIVYAYRRGGELPLAPRRARLRIAAKGDRGSHDESLTVYAPGTHARVTPAEDGLCAGDPLAVDVDVHDVGVGELAVSVDTAAANELEGEECARATCTGADGLLVRVYGREQLSAAEAAFRGATLDRARKEELARWMWELGWDELSAPEREAVLSTRWHRVGASRSSGRDLRSLPVAISPRSREVQAAAPTDALLARVALRGDERIALMLHAGATLHVHSDAMAVLRAVLRGEDGTERSVEGAGEITVTGTPGEALGVEVSSSRDALVDLRSAQADQVVGLGYARAWRVASGRPAIVDSPDAPRVLRVTARRGMDRRDTSVVPIALDVEVSAGKARVTRALRVERARSRYDRYETLDPMDAPSERAVFFVAVPQGGTARIATADGSPVDVSISELDERAPVEPLVARAVGAPPPTVRVEGESVWGGFVPRRPSNASSFPPDARVMLRIARRWGPRATSSDEPALVHVRRAGPVRVEHDGRLFTGISEPFDLTVDAQRPAFLPVLAIADAPATLAVWLEPTRRGVARAGVFDRVTLPRTVDVAPGASRFTYVVGDDIKAGEYRLRIEAKGSANVVVHMPWTATPRAHWLAGQFEE